jgi:hypothetical protein
MSWWKNRQPAEAPDAETASPEWVELIPDRLGVRIYRHTLDTVQHGTMACWTYVTEGLPRLNQPEVSLTLRRLPHTSTPQEPLQFFMMLHQFAEQGRIVNAGDWTQFGSRKFFDRHLMYIPAQPIADVPLSPETILAISVTEEELKAVQSFGILRVMAQLGQQARFYPCPPWLDPNRPGIDFTRTLEESLLRTFHRIRCPQVRILHRMGNRLTLRLSPAIRDPLAEELDRIAENEPVAFLTDLDPEADGCVVWEPDQAEPTAISPPDSQGKQIGGCFAAFVADQETTGGRFIEDGFLVFLTNAEWHSVRCAILGGQSLQIDATDGLLPLYIEWDESISI